MIVVIVMTLHIISRIIELITHNYPQILIQSPHILSRKNYQKLIIFSDLLLRKLKIITKDTLITRCFPLLGITKHFIQVFALISPVNYNG